MSVYTLCAHSAIKPDSQESLVPFRCKKRCAKTAITVPVIWSSANRSVIYHLDITSSCQRYVDSSGAGFMSADDVCVAAAMLMGHAAIKGRTFNTCLKNIADLG